MIILKRDDVGSFASGIVIVVEIINSDNLLAALEKRLGEGAANKSGCPGNENGQGKIPFTNG
jgi:hypothetical protein